MPVLVLSRLFSVPMNPNPDSRALVRRRAHHRLMKSYCPIIRDLYDPSRSS